MPTIRYLEHRQAILTFTGGLRTGSLQAVFSNVEIQPAKVRTRKGYAKKGSGEEVGNTCSPQNILAAVMPKRIEPMMRARRTKPANSLGALVSKSAQDHKAVPAAKEGTLSTREAAVPTSMTLSP